MVFGGLGKFSPQSYLNGLFQKQGGKEKKRRKKFDSLEGTSSDLKKDVEMKKRMMRIRSFRRCARNHSSNDKNKSDTFTAQGRHGDQGQGQGARKMSLCKNNVQSFYPKTPLGLLRRIWDLKIRDRPDKSSKYQQKQSKPGHAVSTSRSRTQGRRDTKRKRSQSGQRNRYPKKRSSSRSRKRRGGARKRTHPSRTKDLKDIRVRRIKRYVSGENDRRRPQVRPLVSRSSEWESVFNDKPKSFRKGSENSNDFIVDDPLNIRKLHHSYVKGLHGKPAHTTDVNNARQRDQRKAKDASRPHTERKKKKSASTTSASRQRFRRRTSVQKRGNLRAMRNRRSQRRCNHVFARRTSSRNNT